MNPENDNRARYVSWQRSIVRTLCTLSCFVLLSSIGVSHLTARDMIKVSADKVAEIDKQSGIMTLKQNVIVTKESTGSRLMTDFLQLTRDASEDSLDKAVAEGNVEVEFKERSGEQGEVGNIYLYCDKAVFNRSTKTVDLEGAVLVRSTSYRLDAHRVTYNNDTGLGKITSKAKTQVRLAFTETETDLTAWADEILLFEKEKKVILQGKVKVENAIDGSVFTSNRAELYFNAEDDIQTMIASQNFRMEQPGRLSKADRAVFDFVLEEVTLTGNANVKVDNEIEVDSSQIVMHMKVEKGIIKSKDDVPVRMTIPIDN